MSMTADAPLVALRLKEVPWQRRSEPVVVGKDILELLSTSMYVDPMTIYREYVQNAADSIDDARAQGILGTGEPGSVSITCDPLPRIIRIRDNGTGIQSRHFIKRLTAFGASVKRGSPARGFRGVGRLAGLGYCQELIFRSRSVGEPKVNELRWDCRTIRNALRSQEFTGDLNQIVNEAVEFRQLPVGGWPAHFFEVELRGVVRHRSDHLLSPNAIENYLSQVVPVPFADNFKFRDEIRAILEPHVHFADMHITINNGTCMIRRPHRNKIEISDSIHDEFKILEPIQVPGIDGNLAAVGWILHHGYVGALPQRSGIRGLRVRIGDVQIGGENLFEELFPESRFNSWCVGEVHVIDKRVVPNGRRDHFEQNVHFDNLLNHLAPHTREIARQCRLNSTRRRCRREFELSQADVEHFLQVLRQRAVPKRQRKIYISRINQLLAEMQKLSQLQEAENSEDTRYRTIIEDLKRRLQKLEPRVSDGDGPLVSLSADKRRVYEHVFALIYECSANVAAAKSLVDRMIKRLNEPAPDRSPLSQA